VLGLCFKILQIIFETSEEIEKDAKLNWKCMFIIVGWISNSYLCSFSDYNPRRQSCCIL